MADTSTGPAQGDVQHQSQVPPEEQAAVAALAQAAASGKPVVIEAWTTPYARTVANPDGTLTQTSTPAPTRAMREGSWTDTDASLQVDGDGGLSPKAAVNDLTLSGGGSGPLATLHSPGGKSLSVTMPFALPKPIVNGSNATYPDVLPDIDLSVAATELGGIREVLVVKSESAARNPALATLHVGTTGAGLIMRAEASGDLTAVDSTTNAPEFTAPAPQMWDSSTSAIQPARSKTGQSTFARASADDSDSASTVDGPGSGAQSATMPTSVSAGGVNISPVADILHGSGTHYPVYIDPDYIPWTPPGTPAWTWIQSAHTGSANFNAYGSAHSQQPGIGLCGTSYPGGGGCNPADTLRTYYQFDVSALGIHNDVIGSAVLTVSQTYSADWDCNGRYGASLSYDDDPSTSVLGDATNWNHHPTDNGTGLTDQVGGTGSTGCTGDVAFAYNVKPQVQHATNLDRKNLTFGLRGDEGNANGLKRLSNKVSLAITYDQVPNQPDGLTSSPVPGYASTGSAQPCESAVNPTDRAFVGNPGLAQGLQLRATVSSPTAPAQPVRGYFSLWDDSASGFPTVGSGYSSGGGYASSGSQVSYSIPTKDLIDGHAYAWNASTSDGILASASSSVCHLRVDLSPPTVTTPTGQVADPTTTFPPAGSGQTTTLHAGQVGQVPFTANDPSPATGVASGLSCVRWGFDPQLSDAKPWSCGVDRPNGAIAVSPGHWGTNILYIQAQDNAGNSSQIIPYAFYVPWAASGPVPVFGDTTGDGSPDILVPQSDGNLYAHAVPGNTQATSPATSLAAPLALSPDHDSWKNYRITHRGSLRGGGNVDGLFVHKDGASELDYYNNPGNTGADGVFDKRVPIRKPSCTDDGSGAYCTGFATDWSTTTQISALGDVSTVTLDSGNFQHRAGILTEEANASGDVALWFYPAVSDSVLATPVRLAAGGWKDLDLISSGDWNHSGRPGLWARDRITGDITAYSFSTGTIPDPAAAPTSTIPTLTAISAGTRIGNLPADGYPTVGSDGDLTGDGVSDLWAVTKSGQLASWSGKTSDGTASTPVTSFGSVTGIGTTLIAADQWRLAGSGKDADGSNPATIMNSVAWGPNHAGTSGGAATFDGAGGYLAAQKTAVDTAHSYSVSAWVKLNTLTATAVAVSQGTANHQAFYLGYTSDRSWQFMTTTASTTASTTYPMATGGPTPTAGAWTHLTGVYDADSNVMSLYVNGVLTQHAAANANPAYDPTAPLTIGGNVTAGDATHRAYNPMNGSISDVRVYPAALTAGQIQRLYTGS
ncbi:LamG domain-containing protein [Streptomyces sp. MAG02]|nr:LamG domain-containing protein [Streptomyces sp. MAG02]